MKKRKVLSAVLSMGLIATFWCSETSAASFKDVSEKSTYYNIIESMSNQNIINGYEDGTFRPNETISRKHASALISRAVKELPRSEKSKPAPKDLSISNPNYNDLMALYNAGLLELDGKGNINPNKALTRGEMAKILAVAFNLEVKASYDFEDITSSNPYQEYIRAIYSNGVTTGYEDGTYRPKDTLTRKHYAAFMYRAMNLDKDFVADPIKAEDIKLSPEMDLEDFNKTIKNNPVFNLYKEHEVAKWVWEGSKSIRTVLTEGQELLKGTDFTFSKIETYVTIYTPSWKNRYAIGFMEAPIGIEGYENETKVTFDHSNEEVTNLALDFIDLMYPDLNLRSEINEKVNAGRQALDRGEKDYLDIENIELNGLTVRYGVSATNQYSRFIVEIK